MTGGDVDRCQVCGAVATVWWPAIDGQWCDRHVPDEMADDEVDYDEDLWLMPDEDGRDAS